MIRFKLGEMMEKKRFADGRRYSISEIAIATGLSRVTLSKILNQKGYGTGTDTIDRLCEFFDCQIGDLMERVPNEHPEPVRGPDVLEEQDHTSDCRNLNTGIREFSEQGHADT